VQSLSRRKFASLFSEGVIVDPDPAPWAARRRRERLFGDSYAFWLRRHCDSIGTAVNLIQTIGLIKFLTIAARPLTNIAGCSSSQTLDNCHGFCGIGGTLQPMPLVGAYASGLYPRAFFGTFSWWSPTSRTGVIPGAVYASQEIDALLDGGTLRVTFDRDFDGIVAACAQPHRSNPRAPLMGAQGPARASLVPALMRAHAALHELGIAHSFEVWDAHNALVGGGYGISVGAVFVCEGLFAQTADIAKAGVATLNRHLAEWGYAFLDFKTHPPSIDMPLTVVERRQYERLLTDHLGGGRYGRWRTEPPAKRRPPLRAA